MLFPDQSFQTFGIAANRNRVLAGDIHGNQFAAGEAQIGFQSAAFADHKRATSGLRDRFGHFDRRAFSPACRQVGDDLQHGFTGKVWPGRFAHRESLADLSRY